MSMLTFPNEKYNSELVIYVLLKASSMHGVIQFGVKDKPTIRYVGPFEMVKRVSDVAYCFGLSLE